VSNRPTRRPSASSKVAAARSGSTGNRTVWIVVGVVVVVLLAAIIAIAVTSSEEPVAGGGPSPSGGTVVPSGDLNYGTVDVSGTPLEQSRTLGASDPAVGETVPSLTGQQFDGASINIAPAGKPKVVMFVAHWCPHCQAEVPRIQDWLDENGMPTDVELYTVATGTTSTQSNFPPGDWLREEGWSVPALVDDEDNTAATAYGLSSYPFFVVVDDTGTVVVRASGELSIDAWEQLLDAARTGVAPSTASDGESSPSS
jgi:cytochrome c biogenesis protein CcmG/thiol:disulfide interchange protein DsbE